MKNNFTISQRNAIVENHLWCIKAVMKQNRSLIRAAKLEQDYHIRINPDTRRETNHFDLSSVTAVTTVTAYCAPKNIVTAVTVVTRRTVLCRFQQSKNVSICISKYGIW